MEFRQKLALFLSTLLLLQELTEPVAGAQSRGHQHTVTTPMGSGGIFLIGSPSIALQRICSGSQLTALGVRLNEQLLDRLLNNSSLKCSSIESMAEEEASKMVDQGYVGFFHRDGFDLPLWVMRRFVVEEALRRLGEIKNPLTKSSLERRCPSDVRIKGQLTSFDPIKYAVRSSSMAYGQEPRAAGTGTAYAADTPANQLQQALSKAAAGAGGEGALVKMAAGVAVALASVAATLVWWYWAPVKNYVHRQYSSFRVWLDESTAKVVEKVRKFVLFERIANGLPVLTQAPWALLRKIRSRRLGLVAILDLIYQAGINSSYPHLDVLLDELPSVAERQNGKHRITVRYGDGSWETVESPVFKNDQLEKLFGVLAAPTMNPYFLSKFVKGCNLDFVTPYIRDLLKHLNRQPLMVQLSALFMLTDINYQGEYPQLDNTLNEMVDPSFLKWIQALTDAHLLETAQHANPAFKDSQDLAQDAFEEYWNTRNTNTDAEIILVDTWVRHSGCLNEEFSQNSELCGFAKEQFSLLTSDQHGRLASVSAGPLLFFTMPKELATAGKLGSKFLGMAARCGPYSFAFAMRTYGYDARLLNGFNDFGPCGPCRALRDHYVSLLKRAADDPSLLKLSICLSKPKIPKGVPEIKVLSQAPPGRITVDVPLEATEEYERMDGPLQEETLRAWFVILTGLPWNETAIAGNLPDGLNRMLRSQCTEELVGPDKMPVVAVLEELDVYQPPKAAAQK